jgi:type IX secretion system PorP/SprF family membrane protein
MKPSARLLMRFLLTTAVFFLVRSAWAQQDPLYAQYLNNPLLLNPAYAGATKNWQSVAGYRTQWGGFAGNPTTFNFASHLSLVDNKVGVGLVAVQDRIAEVKNTEFILNYSYRLEFKDKSFLFGLSTGVVRYNADPGLLNLQEPNDPAFLFTNNFQFNTGVGALLRSERYMAGFSIPKLIPGKITEAGQQIQIYNPHYYLFGAYYFDLTERLALKPALLLKGTSGAPASVDINANMIFNKDYTMGVLTRNFNTFGLLAQLRWKEYRFGYVFEVPTGKSIGQGFSSHEASITYSLPLFGFHSRSGFTNF